MGARLTQALPLHWPPWDWGCCSLCCCSGLWGPRGLSWTPGDGTSARPAGGSCGHLTKGEEDMRKEGLKLEGSGDSLEGGGMARDRVERVYRHGAVTLGQAHQMGLRPATVIQLQGQAAPHLRLTPLCPTAPLLSSSAAQAGGRKIENAPSVSSQDGPTYPTPPVTGGERRAEPSDSSFLPTLGSICPPESLCQGPSCDANPPAPRKQLLREAGQQEPMRGTECPPTAPLSFQPGWGVFQPSARGWTPAGKTRYV